MHALDQMKAAKQVSVTPSQPPDAPRVVVTLLPIMVVVLLAFLIIGLALPVLPLHVHHGLLGTFVVSAICRTGSAAPSRTA